MNRASKALAEEITSLINKKQEGGYWDFKQQWHDSKADLLHDIICLTNNMENRDAYLIFGVEDKTCQIIGINEDNSRNRLNTVGVVNFLRDKKFVGDVRPIARVETIDIEGKELDILIIENSHYTPFRLSQDFKDRPKKSDGKDTGKTVKANNVYTRIQDTNTPIDKTADPDKEERLWRKRLRIDEPAYNKAMYYLENPEDWEKAERDSSDSYIATDGLRYPGLKLHRPAWDYSYYYRYAPEYSIEFTSYCSGTNNKHFLCLLFPDPNCTLMDVVVKVSNQTIYKYFYVDLDGTKAELICPRNGIIEFSDNPSEKAFIMSYVVKGSFECIVNEFLIEKFPIKKQSPDNIYRYIKPWKDCVIQFESEYEKDEFKKYIVNKYNEVIYNQETQNTNDILLSEKIPSISSDLLKYHNRVYKDAQVLMREYETWRNSLNAH
ncbi:MAG: ATP-binding protein [Candidatus Nanosynbacter sp.]|nr:ATP-binding protein [Candidatus Nanosynbacter sp.]